MAGVLQQKGRAQLVGERSFGYAGRRKLVRLSSGDGLLLTDAFYSAPDAEIINRSLVPDVRVRREGVARNSAEPEKDAVLKRAIQRLREEQ